MRVNPHELLPIKEVIRDLQHGSDATRCDDMIGAFKAISGDGPCEKETQLETESVVTTGSAA